MNTPILETSRPILRKFTERDMEALFTILKDEEANKFLPWYPVKDLEETRRFYWKGMRRNTDSRKPTPYAICPKTDNFPIGYVKVDMEEHHDFGYGLRKEFWHRGLPLKRAEPSSPSEERRSALHHRHARQEQPEKRKRDAEARHDVPLLIRRTVATQELPRDIQNVPVKPEWRQRVRVQEILGRGNQSFRRRLVAGHEACCSGGTSHCFLYVYSV